MTFSKTDIITIKTSEGILYSGEFVRMYGPKVQIRSLLNNMKWTGELVAKLNEEQSAVVREQAYNHRKGGPAAVPAEAFDPNGAKGRIETAKEFVEKNRSTQIRTKTGPVQVVTTVKEDALTDARGEPERFAPSMRALKTALRQTDTVVLPALPGTTDAAGKIVKPTQIRTKTGPVKVVNSALRQKVKAEIDAAVTEARGMGMTRPPRLGTAQQELLDYLRPCNGQHVSFRTMAAHFDEKPARMATLIKSLETKGLIRRTKSANGANAYEVL